MMDTIYLLIIVHAKSAIIVGKRINYHKFKIVLNAKIRILINALNAMLQIIVKKILMEILTENAYAIMAIMMMAQIIHANSVIIVGLKIQFIIC